MNQTKKRLSIIKLAISITDLETIQLQILKLLPLQADTQLQEILALLQTDNYAQAQSLITLYIETAPEEVVQRTPVTATQETASSDTAEEKESPSQSVLGAISAEDQAIIDEFQLFVTTSTPEPSPKNEEIDITDFLSHIPESTEEALEEAQTETALSDEDLQEESPIEEAPDQIISEEESEEAHAHEDTDLSDEAVQIENSSEDAFFGPKEERSSIQEKSTGENEDDFFNLEGRDEVFAEDEEKMFKEKASEEERSEEEQALNDAMDVETQALFNHVEEEALEAGTQKSEEGEVQEETEVLTPLTYEYIPHISLKLIDMKRRYPSIQKTYEKFEKVEDLIYNIAKKGYSEKEIQETLESTKTLIANAEYTQAAQLLLVCAATESKFAQFMLARELYIGSVLSKNIPESFALMSALAIDDYPEALCDLGQFYENGIATKVDVTRAEELYKSAANAGIQRAKKHYNRLSKSSKGLFRS